MITNEVNVTRSPVQSKITVQYPGIWTVHLFFGPDKKAIKAELSEKIRFQPLTVDEDIMDIILYYLKNTCDTLDTIPQQIDKPFQGQTEYDLFVQPTTKELSTRTTT